MLSRVALLAPVFILTIMVFSCGGDSAEAIASEVAESWASDSMTSVASDIGGAITGEIPLIAELASSAIEEQIRETVKWSFESPSEIGTNRYSVVARAAVRITVPIPLVADKEYEVSVAFNVVADTGKREVASSQIDLLSLDVRER